MGIGAGVSNMNFSQILINMDINLANTRARRVLLAKETKKSTYFLCPNILSCYNEFFSPRKLRHILYKRKRFVDQIFKTH